MHLYTWPYTIGIITADFSDSNYYQQFFTQEIGTRIYVLKVNKYDRTKMLQYEELDLNKKLIYRFDFVTFSTAESFPSYTFQVPAECF